MKNERTPAELAELALLKYRAAQAAHERKITARWQEIGGRYKPAKPAKPQPRPKRAR